MDNGEERGEVVEERGKEVGGVGDAERAHVGMAESCPAMGATTPGFVGDLLLTKFMFADLHPFSRGGED